MKLLYFGLVCAFVVAATADIDINNSTITDAPMTIVDSTTPEITTVPPTPPTTKPSTTTTTTVPTTTTKPTTPTPITTPTTKPTSKPTPPPTDPPKPTPVPTTTTVKPPTNRSFDGPSFVGGIVLALGMVAIGYVALKFYKAHTEQNYHTL